MTTLLPEVQIADDHIVDIARFDDLVREAEELATLTLDRTMFGPEEVLNLALDVRALMVEAKAALALALVPA